MISILQLKNRIKNILNIINKMDNDKINTTEVAIEVLNENDVTQEIYVMFNKYSD
jgi:hypothetical protein